MFNRKEYLKKYNKTYSQKHYKELRAYRTLWERAKRDRERLFRIKKQLIPVNNILSKVGIKIKKSKKI